MHNGYDPFMWVLPKVSYSHLQYKGHNSVVYVNDSN